MVKGTSAMEAEDEGREWEAYAHEFSFAFAIYVERLLENYEFQGISPV